MTDDLKLLKWQCQACKEAGIPLTVSPDYVLQLLDEIQRLQGEKWRLVDALKQFALTADYWDKLVRQGGSFGAEDVVPMRIEPYREARAVLNSIKQERS